MKYYKETRNEKGGNHEYYYSLFDDNFAFYTLVNGAYILNAGFEEITAQQFNDFVRQRITSRRAKK